MILVVRMAYFFHLSWLALWEGSIPSPAIYRVEFTLVLVFLLVILSARTAEG